MIDSNTSFEEFKAQLNEASNKSVTGDMLSRLESKLPKGAFGAPTPMPPLSMGTPLAPADTVKSLEDSIKALKERFDEVMSAKSTTTEEDSMLVGTQESMKAAFDALNKIVYTFNTSLQDWYKKSGCVVNFSWKYDPYKIMEIASVDVIVYRKSAPSSLTIKEALEKAPTEV